jgi:hypothetical protein
MCFLTLRLCAFDLLYNNPTDFDPDVVSTDTHGTNQVNFVMLDIFGYKLAPRYPGIEKVFNTLFEIDGNNKNVVTLKRAINY